jgi:hypothetical protein
MSGKNDGGAAFPHEKLFKDDLGNVIGRFTLPGMSLRDYFAGQALAGCLASHANPSSMAYPDPAAVTFEAYRYADAMIAEREVGR